MSGIFENKLSNVSLKVKNYKCFGDKPQGFDRILPINIIIGRNNTGKSSLLELVQYAVTPYPGFQNLKHGDGVPEVLISQPLQEGELSKVFQKNSSHGVIPGNHWEYGSRWIGKTITYSLETGGKTFVDLSPSFDRSDIQQQFNPKIATAAENPFAGKIFKRLLAERDIIPEKEVTPMHLESNGLGATNILRRYINMTSLPTDLVEVKLLAELNNIFIPDSNYQGITIQTRQEGEVWEIFLQEANKGTVSLSNTGSGFKTILLVLMFLYLIPHIEGKPLYDYIFAFEELENNVHPALQRRLLLYLREFAMANGCILFLTTHSNIVIDMFSRDEQAQILHVTHDGKEAQAKHAQTYIDNRGILDDLDIRASDLLQANSVIWVEGPSDRLYINRWIEMWTDGKLKEGVDYQCIFYGGRLLAHLSAENPEQYSQGAISMLRLNKNAAIVIDSDKKKSSDIIGNTKMRLKEEINRMGGTVWITAGKEIENYLPSEAISQLLGASELPALAKFEDIAEYLNKNVGINEGNKFKKGKPQFAADICPLITKENINTLDLSSQLKELCNKISEWNKVPLQTVQE
ncbi:MAG: AAA family ATPase [Dehalococcoidia bacterium]|nr:AAA family ATPase [Dehalococcoidia bacterium]